MNYSLKGKCPQLSSQVGFIAPSADLVGDVTIAEGVNIWFNAVLRGDMDAISIGKNTNIQDCAVVHTDLGLPCHIGGGVTLGHSAVIHGCTIGDHCLVGMGAIVLNEAEIGDECLIGAGSLVPQGMKVPPRSLVFGSPARVVKDLSQSVIDNIRKNGNVYLANSQDYLDGMRLLNVNSE